MMCFSVFSTRLQFHERTAKAVMFILTLPIPNTAHIIKHLVDTQ